MREIRFRGKRVDNGELVSGYYFTTPLTDEATGSKPEDGWSFLSGRTRHCISKNNCVYEVIPESVGQFTGLHDKNGQEIYEGDVVETRGSELFPSELFSVEYTKGSFCLIGNDGKGFEIWRQCNYSGGVDTGRTWCEVIGNIYENPSLLEVQP